MSGLRVAVASDWPEVRTFVMTLLRGAGHHTAAFVPGKALPFQPDVVVRDASGARDHPLDGPTVLMSGSWTTDWLMAARDSGAICLSKPFTQEQLLDAVTQAAQSG